MRLTNEKFHKLYPKAFEYFGVHAARVNYDLDGFDVYEAKCSPARLIGEAMIYLMECRQEKEEK